MSDRFKAISVDYDDRTVLYGRVARLPSKKLEYDCFRVITHIGNIDYDVTVAFSEEHLAHFKQAFELELEMKYRDALSEVNDCVYDWDHEEPA